MALATVSAMFGGAVGRVFPAAQLVVVDNDERVLDLAVGDCDHATLFDVASLTKPLVTTTLAMRLIEQGTLALDHELRSGMSVRLALCHATGLPAWRPLHAQARGCQAIVDRVRKEPPEAPPGTRSVYSDLGFVLLGDAIARAGGTPLDEQWRSVAKEQGSGALFQPEPGRIAPTSSDEVPGQVNDLNARAMGGVAGHAGLFASARDIDPIVRALVAAWGGGPVDDHPPIARPETVRAFWSPCGVPGSTWCLGWDRPSLSGSQAGQRWPRDGVGHLGFTGCSIWIAPARRRWVILLANRVFYGDDGAAIQALRPALHDAIVEALDCQH